MTKHSSPDKRVRPYNEEMVDSICDYLLAKEVPYDSALSLRYSMYKSRHKRVGLSKPVLEHFERRGVRVDGVWYPNKRSVGGASGRGQTLEGVKELLKEYREYLDSDQPKDVSIEKRVSKYWEQARTGKVGLDRDGRIALFRASNLVDPSGSIIRKVRLEPHSKGPSRRDRVSLYLRWVEFSKRRAVVIPSSLVAHKVPEDLRRLHLLLEKSLPEELEALYEVGYPKPHEDRSLDLDYIAILKGKYAPLLRDEEVLFLKNILRYRNCTQSPKSLTTEERKTIRSWARYQQKSILSGTLPTGELKTHIALGNLDLWGLRLTGRTVRVKGKSRPEVVSVQ